MRVAVTEGPEYLVDALARALIAGGDQVVLLARPGLRHDAASLGVVERPWDPSAGRISGASLEDVDAVVNLYGSSPVRRWTTAIREDLQATRITGTLSVVSALDPDGRCQRLLNLSSTAFYGDRAGDRVDAGTPRGSGFLAGVIAEWEGAARHSPVPTALLRTPHVLAPTGGYLDERQGWLRGRLGTGRQYVPWVHVSDWVAAVLLLLSRPVEGPVNMVAPEPVTEARFVAELGRVTGHRPGLSVPEALLNARFGADAARDLWLSSARTIPQVLADNGFEHRFRTLPEALADVAFGPAARGR